MPFFRTPAASHPEGSRGTPIPDSTALPLFPRSIRCHKPRLTTIGARMFFSRRGRAAFLPDVHQRLT